MEIIVVVRESEWFEIQQTFEGQFNAKLDFATITAEPYFGTAEASRHISDRLTLLILNIEIYMNIFSMLDDFHI